MATPRLSSLPDLDYGSDRSGPSRTSSSSSIFPAHEPADYCTPVLSLPEPPKSEARRAVLVPRALWKRDRDAFKCDTYDCTTEFSIRERRHHCRKCGGVYCQQCSSKTFPLLDTSKMPFHIPPAHMPLTLLAASSPTGALIPSRVCDDCHAQLSGEESPSFLRSRSVPSSSTSLPAPKSTFTSLAMAESPHAHHFDEEAMRVGPSCQITYIKKPRHMRRSLSRTHSTASTTLGSPLSSDGGVAPVRRLSQLSTCTSSSTGDMMALPRSVSPTTSASTRSINSPLPTCSRASPTPRHQLRRASTATTSGLDNYPLRIASRECKLAGSAFWEAKPPVKRVDAPVWYDARLVTIVPPTVSEDAEDDDFSPVVPERRKIRLFRDMWSAPFGLPEHQLEPHRLSTF